MSGERPDMRARLRRLPLVVLICAGALGLSYFTNYTSGFLVAAGIAHDLQTREYVLDRLVLADMLVQSLYFSVLTFWTRRPPLLLIMVAVHIIDVVMFLRYGSPFLWASVAGAPSYFGAKL